MYKPVISWVPKVRSRARESGFSFSMMDLWAYKTIPARISSLHFRNISCPDSLAISSCNVICLPLELCLMNNEEIWILS